MHSLELQFHLYARLRHLTAGLVVFSLVISCANWAQADFSGSGDIVGDVDNAGNTTSPGDLIIGDEGTAGVFGDGALPLVGGDLNPLRSDLTIIGNEERSLGAVTIEDFLFLPNETDPRGGNWLIDEDLAVGNNGQGFLDLLNSARVEVADDTWVGGSDGSGALVNATGEGYGLITVNGAGTRLVTGDRLTRGFYVGFNGVGDVEVSGRGSIESLGFAVIGEEDGANGLVTLTDRGTRWTIDSDLTIGNSRAGTTTASGTLRIYNEAWVQVKDNVFVNSRGVISLAGGSIELLDLAGDTITNNGIIRGHGFIDGALSIGAGGLLSNSAASVQNGPIVTNFRESLRVSGAVTNAGVIESIGGEMIFDSLVTNNNSIIARDAILRFSNSPSEDSTIDLINTDLLSLAGDITVIGDIDSSGGDIFTLDDTTLLLQGNLTFTSGIFGIAADGDGPPITVTGFADLGGATIDLVLSSGFSPAVGEPFELLQAAGGVVFPANAMDSANGRIFDFSIVGNTLFAEDTGFLVNPVGADFNGDGIVNALDLAIWRNNYPIASGAPKTLGDADGDGDVDASDYMKLQRDLGIIPVPPITAVPEPSTLALVLLTLVCCPRRRP